MAFESKIRPGSFGWMQQQPPKPLVPANRPITPKENLRRVFAGEKPMWMPVWLTDSQYCWPDVILEHPQYELDGKDWFGTEWVWVETAGGMMVKPGTRMVNDITKWREEMPLPDLSKVDFAADAKNITSLYDPDRMHFFQTTEGLFERLHEALPFDEALLLMMTEPEAVQDFFTAIADYKIAVLDKVFEHYAPIDYITYNDDWGTQRSGFFSNEMFRESIMPQTKRIWDHIHASGRFIELHSCGLTQQYINEMIEMGLDAWAPQSINDFDMLTEKYGHQITIVVPIPGAAEATDEAEARACVRRYVDTYAPRGRVVAFFANPNPEIQKVLNEELYNYSSEFYAK